MPTRVCTRAGIRRRTVVYADKSFRKILIAILPTLFPGVLPAPHLIIFPLLWKAIPIFYCFTLVENILLKPSLNPFHIVNSLIRVSRGMEAIGEFVICRIEVGVCRIFWINLSDLITAGGSPLFT